MVRPNDVWDILNAFDFVFRLAALGVFALVLDLLSVVDIDVVQKLLFELNAEPLRGEEVVILVDQLA